MKKPSLRRWVIPGVLTVILLVAVWMIYSYALSQTSKTYVFHGIPYDSIKLAPDFILIDQNNQIVQLSDYRGKVVMLYFGFTYCPEACPITFGIWNQVSAKLGDKVDDVQFLFITVDPERDTSEQIAKHLSLFTADITGLTGTLEDIEDVAIDYSVFFEKIDSEDSDYYLVNHTTLTFLINQSGELVQAFPYATSADDIMADIEYLLQ